MTLLMTWRWCDMDNVDVDNMILISQWIQRGKEDVVTYKLYVNLFTILIKMIRYMVAEIPKDVIVQVEKKIAGHFVKIWDSIDMSSIDYNIMFLHEDFMASVLGDYLRHL